jgi:hypothetical protein
MQYLFVNFHNNNNNQITVHTILCNEKQKQQSSQHETSLKSLAADWLKTISVTKYSTSRKSYTADWLKTISVTKYLTSRRSYEADWLKTISVT